MHVNHRIFIMSIDSLRCLLTPSRVCAHWTCAVPLPVSCLVPRSEISKPFWKVWARAAERARKGTLGKTRVRYFDFRIHVTLDPLRFRLLAQNVLTKDLNQLNSLPLMGCPSGQQMLGGHWCIFLRHQKRTFFSISYFINNKQIFSPTFIIQDNVLFLRVLIWVGNNVSSP